MKLFKLAALFVIATIPILLKKNEKPVEVVGVETDHIFDAELSAD